MYIIGVLDLAYSCVVSRNPSLVKPLQWKALRCSAHKKGDLLNPVSWCFWDRSLVHFPMMLVFARHCSGLVHFSDKRTSFHFQPTEWSSEVKRSQVVDSKIGAPLAYSAVLNHPLNLCSAYAAGSLGRRSYTIEDARICKVWSGFEKGYGSTIEIYNDLQYFIFFFYVRIMWHMCFPTETLLSGSTLSAQLPGRLNRFLPLGSCVPREKSSEPSIISFTPPATWTVDGLDVFEWLVGCLMYMLYNDLFYVSLLEFAWIQTMVTMSCFEELLCVSSVRTPLWYC